MSVLSCQDLLLPEEEDLELPHLQDEEHADIHLRDEVVMEDGFLLIWGEEVVLPVVVDLEVDIVGGLDLEMEGVIRIVHDREVEVLIGMLEEIVGGEDGVQVIVVILVGVRPLLGKGVELGVEVLYPEGRGIGAWVAVEVLPEIAVHITKFRSLHNGLILIVTVFESSEMGSVWMRNTMILFMEWMVLNWPPIVRFYYCTGSIYTPTDFFDVTVNLPSGMGWPIRRGHLKSTRN
jgi:hypothetical protein